VFPHFHGGHIDVMSTVTGLQLSSPLHRTTSVLVFTSPEDRQGPPYPVLMQAVGGLSLEKKRLLSSSQTLLTDLTLYLLMVATFYQRTVLYMLSHERNVHLNILNESTWQSWVKYGVRSPKYIWATVYCCNVLIG
jgi:hypothetical protein